MASNINQHASESSKSSTEQNTSSGGGGGGGGVSVDEGLSLLEMLRVKESYLLKFFSCEDASNVKHGGFRAVNKDLKGLCASYPWRSRFRDFTMRPLCNIKGSLKLFLACFPNAQTLNLHGNRLNDEELVLTMQHMGTNVLENLYALDISECPFLTSDCLLLFTDSPLVILDISGNKAMSEAALINVTQSHLDVVFMGGNSKDPDEGKVRRTPCINAEGLRLFAKQLKTCKKKNKDNKFLSKIYVNTNADVDLKAAAREIASKLYGHFP